MLTVEKQLATVALGLPPKRRARLAELLLQSLEGQNENEVAKIWAKEAMERSKAHRAGKLKAVPVEVAFGFKP